MPENIRVLKDETRNIDFIDHGVAFDMLERTGLNEILQEPSSRRGFFANLGDEQYTQFAGYINARTRGESPTYTYHDGVVQSGVTPPADAKDPLMRQAFQAVRDILGNVELDDRAALLRAGLTMAGALHMIHPYQDGNGRTARLLDYLMQYGSERGRRLFEDETRAIVAQAPAYVGERKCPIYDGPNVDVVYSLYRLARPRFIAAEQERGHEISLRDKSSFAVQEFLDVMSGKREGVLQTDAIISSIDGPAQVMKAGKHTIFEVYEAEFKSMSAAPAHQNTDPTQMERYQFEGRDLSRPETIVKIDFM